LTVHRLRLLLLRFPIHDLSDFDLPSYESRVTRHGSWESRVTDLLTTEVAESRRGGQERKTFSLWGSENPCACLYRSLL